MTIGHKPTGDRIGVGRPSEQETILPASNSKNEGKWFWVLLGGLSVACIVPIWLYEYFPSQNGPSLLLIAFMQRELNNPALGYSAYYQWHAFPVPYMLQTTGLNVLFLVFTPLVAQKLWVSFILLVRPFSVGYFLNRLGRGRELYALACLPFLYDFSLMRGYSNFHAGLSIGFIVFGFYLANREKWCRSAVAIFNLLILLLYFTHPIALVLTGFLLAVYEVALTRSLLSVPGIVVRGFLPSLILLVAFASWSFCYTAWMDNHVTLSTLSDKVQNVFYRGATPLSPIANGLSLLVLVAIASGGLVTLWRKYARQISWKSFGALKILSNEPMLAVLLTTCLLYLLMPWTLVGWHKADVRVLPLLFLLVLAIPQPLTSRRVRAVFMGVASLLVLVQLIPICHGLRQGSAEVEEYVAGIDAVPMRSRILPLFGMRKRGGKWALCDTVNPLRRADAYYCLARGGASGKSLAVNNTLYWVWYKDYGNRSGFPNVDAKNPTSEQLDKAAAFYNIILLWNDDCKLEKLFAWRGFTRAFARKRLVVLKRSTGAVATPI